MENYQPHVYIEFDENTNTSILSVAIKVPQDSQFSPVVTSPSAIPDEIVFDELDLAVETDTKLIEESFTWSFEPPENHETIITVNYFEGDGDKKKKKKKKVIWRDADKK